MTTLTRRWSTTLAGRSERVTLTAIEPERDVELVARWMNEPHVAIWWGLAGPSSVTLAHLRQQGALPHLQPWVADIDGAPVAYVETYRVADDPLADHVAFDGTELGWHVLLGVPELRGTGAARLVGRAVIAGLLRNDGVSAVVCEPNADNRRMIGYCESLGHRQGDAVELPDKTARIMTCARAAFASRWPDDLDGPALPAAATGLLAASTEVSA